MWLLHRLHWQYGGCIDLRSIHGGRGSPSRVPHGGQALNDCRSALLPSLSQGASSGESIRQGRPWKHPPGPTILLLQGIRLSYAILNCSWGATRLLQICRVYFLQQPPFERNEPLSIAGIPVFLLPVWLAGVGEPANISTEYHNGSSCSFQFCRTSTPCGWQVLLDLSIGFSNQYCGVIHWCSFHRLSCVSSMSAMSEEVVESTSGVPMSLHLASCMAFPRPSKISDSLKVVYIQTCHLSSHTLIAKGQGLPDAGGLASSAQYWIVCT